MGVDSGTLVTPGQRLGLADELEAGSGTAVQGAFLCASLVGTTLLVAPLADADNANESAKPRLSVLRAGAQPIVPAVGDVVTARVTRINPRQAVLDILCVGPAPVAHRYGAIIRQQDVRATEIDKVQMHLCFRPGDIVRAEVLSLGDSRSYYLTAAKNELGVVYAKGPTGVPMVALSWEEMECPSTKTIEKRKVAKTTV